MKDSAWKSILFLMALLISLGIILWLIGWVFTVDLRAGQWYNVNQFKGLSTHTNGINQDMSVARGVDGWFVRNEGLVKPWFTKIRGNPVTTTPTYILGQNSDNDAVLFYSDNFFSMRNGVVDPIGYAQTPRVDSAYMLATTDSTLYNWEDGHGSLVDTTHRSADHWWLMWTLTTRSSVVWDSLTIPVLGWYSNRWILTNNANAVVQTRPTGFPIATPSVDEGSGTLELDIDSTLIFDGTYIWVYSADTDSILNSETTTFTMPTYPDTGRVKNTYESGDSLILVIDPVDSIYTQATEFWILWDDSLITHNHAIPCSILSVIEYGTDSMRCIVLADTTKYKGANHYHGRQNGSGDTHMFYLLYKPGAMTQRARLGGSSVPAKSRDSLITTGGQSIGPLKFAVWNTHAQTGTGIENLEGFTTRTTDGNIWQLTTNSDGALGDPTDEDTAYAMLIGYSTSSSFGANYRWFSFLLWDTDSIKASEWGHGGNAVNSLYHRPKKQDWAVTTVSTNTLNDRFAVMHQQRTFASGNTHISSTTGKRDSTTWIRYSRVASHAAGDTAAKANADTINYMAFSKNFKFQIEGNDPVTGLSSMGQTLNIYRRRGISLMSGFAQSQFSVYPAPVGQGAANHWCIARSPLHNQDVLTNENGIFFFGGSGLEPLSTDISEVFSDSINWYAESKIRGAVFDNMYFVTVPFDADTTNTDMIGLDLESRNAWLMTKPRLSSIWNFRDDDGSEQWFGGDADSTVIWELGGASNNLYFTPEWKSSWSDLGDAEQVKSVLSHRIEFDAALYTDTLFVDWYLDLTDTLLVNDSVKTAPVWTDTIPCNTNEAAFLARYPSSDDYPAGVAAWSSAQNAARGQDIKRQTVLRNVPRKVSGKFLSFGIRGRSVTAAPLTVMNYGFEYQAIGTRRK